MFNEQNKLLFVPWRMMGNVIRDLPEVVDVSLSD